MSKSVLDLPWVPTPTDGQTGETLRAQAETEHTITDSLTAHTASFASPLLQRGTHLNWLAGLIRQPLPQGYTSLDASRPWLLYWVLHSFALLGGELDLAGKDRVVETLMACQADEGGFGGGPGQLPHLAPTYAAVCALAYAGGWDRIERKKMHSFLLSLKQPAGSFIMHNGGEVDVRGTYCALSVATILNLLTPALAANTPEFIANCQTYEGGLASSAQPYTTDGGLSAPLGEAHGGYAFCAAASWAILRVFSSPRSPAYVERTRHRGEKRMDLKALRRWAAAMQAAPIEGGGFRGRTNKLVDGCYSWWNGALFAVLGALLDEDSESAESAEPPSEELYSREGLQEYVLLCAQGPNGGLRDKPGKHPDAYHTCYNLSGLASAQHALHRPASAVQHKREQFVLATPQPEQAGVELILDAGESAENAERRMREVWASAMGWCEGRTRVVGGPDNELAPTNPIVNVVQSNLERVMAHFYGQPYVHKAE